MIKFRIPTLPEVVQSGVCLLTGHTWVLHSDGVTYYCIDCGAVK